MTFSYLIFSYSYKRLNCYRLIYQIKLTNIVISNMTHLKYERVYKLYHKTCQKYYSEYPKIKNQTLVYQDRSPLHYK